MGSPFERVFDPSAGGGGLNSVLGLVGRAFGVQTAEERKAQAESQILSDLAKYHTETGDPQQAVLRLLQSPRGVDLLSNPGAMEVLDTFKKSITPPPPNVMSPGTQALDPYTHKPIASNPTVKTQEFQAGVPDYQTTPAAAVTTAFQGGKPGASVAQPPEGTQNFQAGVPQIANTQAGGKTNIIQGGKVTGEVSQPTESNQNFANVASGVDPSIVPKLQELRVAGTPEQQKALEINRLVQAGKLSPEAASGYMAGTHSVVDQLNENGEKTGNKYWVNMVDGTMKLIVPEGGVRTTTPGAALPSEIPLTSVNPDGSINAATAFPPSEQMFFKSGPLGLVTKYGGRLVRSINPANKEQVPLEVEQADAHRALLRKGLIDIGSSGNGRLKTKVESWLPLIPGEGFTEDPKAAIVNGRALVIDMRKQKEQEDAIANNVMRSHAERREGRENSLRLQQAIDLLPTPQRLEAMWKQIETGEAPVINPGTAIKTGANLVKEGARDVAATGRDVVGSKPAAPVKPEEQAFINNLPKMTTDDLERIDVSRLSPQARNAMAARIREIKGKLGPKKKD